jgi:hypothetical protein
VEQVEQIDIAVTQARHARDPIADVRDLDCDATIIRILRSPDPIRGRVDHIARRERFERIGIIPFDAAATLHQLWMQCPFHATGVSIEPPLDIVEDHGPDLVLVAHRPTLSELTVYAKSQSAVMTRVACDERLADIPPHTS